MNVNWICPICRVHTQLKVKQLGNGLHKYTCRECYSISPIYDKDEIEVKEKDLHEQAKDWGIEE